MLWERMIPPLEQLSLPQLSVFSPNRAKRHFLDRLYISWTHSGGLKRFAPKFLLCSEIPPPRFDSRSSTLIMRTYVPTQTIQVGTYKLPNVERASR
jgi:hypothetical protein